MTALLALLLFPAPRVDMDVVYSKVAGEELKMDVYFPERTAGAVSPAVLVIHGGAWISGKRQDMAEIAQGLAKEGFVAATTSYRLAPKHRWPAMLDDVQTAVRFLRSKSKDYGIETSRIGACGASAGGHLSLLLGFRETREEKPSEFPGISSKVQAVFNIFGPADFRRDFPATLDGLIETVLGKKKADAVEDIRQACPVEWINKDSAPVFTLHGEADPLVPFAQSKWLKEKLDGAHIPNDLRIVPKMVHGIDKNSPDQMKGVSDGVQFLKKYLAIPTANL